MIRYWAFWLGSKLAPRVPLAWGYRVAWLLGHMAYFLAGRPRRAVRANLSRVLGEGASPAQLGRVARAVFVNGARNYFDLLRISRFDAEELQRRLSIHGLEHLHEAVAQGHGVILSTAHMGTPDLAVQVLRQLYPSLEMIIPVEPIRPEPLLRLVTGLRASQGLDFVPLGVGTLKRALRVLRKGGLVGLPSDRDIQGSGLGVPFFGQETSMPTGALELARHTGAAVVLAFCVREKDFRFTVYVDPPLPLEWSGQTGADLLSNLSKLVAVLERYLRRYPEQWVVFQPIWPGQGERLGIPGSSHFVASVS